MAKEKMMDLIERSKAIDAVHGAIFEFFDICDDGEELPITHKDKKLLEINKAISGRIKKLPSAQPEPQWIPCSETEDLPEHEVLCCDKYGEELIGWLSCEDDQWICESDGEMMYDPIAWREKPEPWRGEEK